MAETERHVRLFRNGRNQALRIPHEFKLDGDQAIMRKEGDRLIIKPVRKGRLLALLASLEPLESQFPDVNEDLALVTANTREFERVPSLRVDNWLLE